MNRRSFFKSAGIQSVVFSATPSLLPGETAQLQSAAGEAPAGSLVRFCRAILEQNLLRDGETLVVATPHVYDAQYISALLSAASDIGAAGAHVSIIPKVKGTTLVSGLTAWHWDLYASADLLITAHLGAPPEIPYPFSGYKGKVGKHPFRTDFDYINRAGSKTRWLWLLWPVYLQRLYFPTPERQELTLKAAKILQETKEIRIRSAAGSDFTVRKEGRPGGAQYGIVDAPGRWDNFGYGCVACGPEEFTAEGIIVLEPGDIIPDLDPYPILTEPVRLTWNGGYVTKIDGGLAANRFEALLASYQDKESYGIAHVGFGTHEKATLRVARDGSASYGMREEIAMFHHNAIGSILFSLGSNFGHGSEPSKYSGLGMTMRSATSHTHFALFNADFHCDGTKVIDKGKLLL